MSAQPQPPPSGYHGYHGQQSPNPALPLQFHAGQHVPPASYETMSLPPPMASYITKQAQPASQQAQPGSQQAQPGSQQVVPFQWPLMDTYMAPQAEQGSSSQSLQQRMAYSQYQQLNEQQQQQYQYQQQLYYQQQQQQQQQQEQQQQQQKQPQQFAAKGSVVCRSAASQFSAHHNMTSAGEDLTLSSAKTPSENGDYRIV
ncbi:hypothetical protein MY3296_010088 [Beauveria thailandica]